MSCLIRLTYNVLAAMDKQSCILVSMYVIKKVQIFQLSPFAGHWDIPIVLPVLTCDKF